MSGNPIVRRDFLQTLGAGSLGALKNGETMKIPQFERPKA